jgi:hypothetical protein
MATPTQVAALIAYVGGRTGPDDVFAEAKYDEASALVDQYVGVDNYVPAAVLDQAVLEVASKLWVRRSAPLGQAQYDTIDGAPILTPRDPMVTVYPTLDRFLPGGFA